jgi:hypothetical protein
MRWTGHTTSKKEIRNTKILAKNLERRGVWRPRCRWEDNINMHIREIWCEGVDLNKLAQNRIKI